MGGVTERRPGSRGAQVLGGIAALALGILVIRAFHGAGRYYQDWHLPYGTSLVHVHPQEIAFLVLYGLHAALAALLLTGGLLLVGAAGPLEALARRVRRRPDLLVIGAAVVMLLAMLVLVLAVFQGAPVTDDEPTYLFIARTLLEGRVINPSPGDEGFFQNMFLIFNGKGWYGKYPIGHPLLLAIGVAAGAVRAVPPLVSAGTLVLTWFVGARLVGRGAATLAVCLLALSPQFVMTGATLLSQPTATFVMILALLLTLRFEEAPDPARAALASAAWSFGVLVRPLPGILFIAVIMAWVLWRLYADRIVTGGRRLGILAAAALPAVFFAGLFLLINRLQSGDVTTTGYHTPGTGLGVPIPDGPILSMAILGSVLRQAVWLFGWPLSYLFLPFARGRRSLFLPWALLGAVLAYRIVVPKTFVSATGPIYLMEATPLLALLTGAGVLRLRDWLGRHGLQRLRAAVAPALIALTVTSFTMFVPVQIRNLTTSCAAVHLPVTLLKAMPGERKDLVFANWLVPGTGVSWHLFPPPPSPRLDDPIIFVRIPAGTTGTAPLLDFWQRRFPDRAAWIYDPRAGSEPPLRLLAPIPVDPVDTKGIGG
ncbi:MAG: glycosyltransferase family 39 protein [Pseudomonadota bacterium]